MYLHTHTHIHTFVGCGVILPFLGGGHQSGQLAAVEPLHGEPVQRQVCAGGEVGIQLLVHLEAFTLSKKARSRDRAWTDVL